MIFAVVPQGPQAEIPRNIMAGFAVALAMIPESVAFAFVVGVTPIAGLWSAVCLGFLAAAFGGRPGIASGAAGSTAVVMAALVDSHGISYLSAAVMLAGIMQITVGVLRWGKFIKLVPHPVMLGFVNGLAIVIANAQLSHFFDPATGALLAGAKGASMLGLTALSMALVKLLPRLTTAVPSSLLTVVLITVLTKVFHLPAQTLSDIAGAETFRGGLSVLPHFGLAQVPWGSWQTWRVLLPYSATMAAVGLIESLLTLQLVDGLMDDGKRGDTRKECIGQGLGNIASGLTGGMGGCAMIGQTQVNIQAGARGRLAGISMALLLGLGIVAAAPAPLGTGVGHGEQQARRKQERERYFRSEVHLTAGPPKRKRDLFQPRQEPESQKESPKKPKPTPEEKEAAELVPMESESVSSPSSASSSSSMSSDDESEESVWEDDFGCLPLQDSGARGQSMQAEDAAPRSKGALATLLQMGFDEKRAAGTLEATGGNVEKAIAALVRGSKSST
ncbi:unnamed protein product [Effrenium voratum]|nr:unnamed protein product [Effrenium voratum]